MGNILIVDDNKLLKEIVTYALQAAGHTTKTAENGGAAIAELKATHYDLVLMDIKMPIMTGIEAVARIRADADEMTARTPVFAYSTEQIPLPREFCMKHGFDDFIDKTAGLSVMLSCVNSFFAKRASR